MEDFKSFEEIEEFLKEVCKKSENLKSAIIEFDEKLKNCNKSHSEWGEFKAKKRKVFTKLSRHVYRYK